MSPTAKKWAVAGFTLLAIGFLYLVRHVLLPFIISGVFIYLLAPVVERLAGQKFIKWHASRGIAVVLIFIHLFFIVALLVLIVVPPLYQEVLKMAHELPQQIAHIRTEILPLWIAYGEDMAGKAGIHLDLKNSLDHALSQALATGEGKVQSVAVYAQKLVVFLLSAVSSFVVIMIVTAFVLIDLPNLKKNALAMLPKRFRQGALDLAHAIDKDLSGAIRGQLVICVINGTLTTVGLLILKVKFALTIGLIAGVFSLIPVFGAVMSSVPAVLIALTQSLLTAVGVLGMIAIVHFIEANFLNPKVMGHNVELHPAIVIFSIVCGEHFLGAVGLLFGVPVAAILRSVLRYFYRQFFLEPEDLTGTAPLPPLPPITENPA